MCHLDGMSSLNSRLPNRTVNLFIRQGYTALPVNVMGFSMVIRRVRQSAVACRLFWKSGERSISTLLVPSYDIKSHSTLSHQPVRTQSTIVREGDLMTLTEL